MTMYSTEQTIITAIPRQRQLSVDHIQNVRNRRCRLLSATVDLSEHSAPQDQPQSHDRPW